MILRKYKLGFKKGLTLIEMLMAISIFSMGIAGFSLLFINSWKTNSFIIEEGMAVSQATQATSKISRELRGIQQSSAGTYLIEKATNVELVVFRNEDTDAEVERVRYYLDDQNNRLIKGVAQYSDGAYPSGHNSDAETVLAEYVVNESVADPVFIYYDHLNQKLTPPLTLVGIRVIEINLWINIKPLSAPDNVKISTSVELRNLDGI